MRIWSSDAPGRRLPADACDRGNSAASATNGTGR